MSNFNFAAPQYVDLSAPTGQQLADYGEDYFEVAHEHEIGYSEVVVKSETITTNDDIMEPEEEQMNENCVRNLFDIREKLFDETLSPDELFETPLKLRRSMSVGAIEPITRDADLEQDMCCALENLKLSAKKCKKILTTGTMKQAKSHTVLSMQEKLQAQQSRRISSRDALHYSNDKLKRKGMQEDTQPRKYISLAEAVKKFQLGTPTRFHSKPKNETSNSLTKWQRVGATKPQSPMLATKARARAVSYVSQVEREEKEAEEMKKHQQKAHPINPNIMRAPVLNVRVEKKPNTRPEPFNFSEVKYKPVAVEKQEVYQFLARPAPKTTTVPSSRPNTRHTTFAAIPVAQLTKNKKLEKLPVVSEDVDNKKINVKKVELHYKGVPKVTPQKLVKTRLEPFSFEERDKRMQQKKEEKIRKFLEEEKKAREFHARPISSAISKSSQHVESKVIKMITEGTLTTKNNENIAPDNELPKPFKARPATVIRKKPFQPKIEEKPLIEVTEFTLNTGRRACERENFEKKLKEKEEGMERYKREYEEKIKRAEEEQIAKLRKETVHKANPVKAYKTFKVLPSSKEVTSPQSPQFSKLRSRTGSMNLD